MYGMIIYHIIAHSEGGFFFSVFTLLYLLLRELHIFRVVQLVPLVRLLTSGTKPVSEIFTGFWTLLLILAYLAQTWPTYSNAEVLILTTVWYVLFGWHLRKTCPFVNRNGERVGWAVGKAGCRYRYEPDGEEGGETAVKM